jgi:prepilin-type processing-associated H-X9-DG protein
MNYESANGTFLPGISRSGCCWGTWMIPVLPYMEQQSLFGMYVGFGGEGSYATMGAVPRYGSTAAGVGNGTIARTKLKTFLCPSDESKTWNNGTLTLHNYVLNAGNTTLYQVDTPIGCTGGNTTGTGTTPGCVTFGGAPFAWYNDPATLAAGGDSSPVDYTGGSPAAGKLGKPQTITGITDGTSNTVCVSEVLQAPSGGDDIRGFTWWGGGAGFVTYQTPNSQTAYDVMTGGGCGPLPQPADSRFKCTMDSVPSIAGQMRLQLARSKHTGGVNAGLCDGSVRFIANSVDLAVWRAAGTSRGGEVLALP